MKISKEAKPIRLFSITPLVKGHLVRSNVKICLTWSVYTVKIILGTSDGGLSVLKHFMRK